MALIKLDWKKKIKFFTILKINLWANLQFKFGLFIYILGSDRVTFGRVFKKFYRDGLMKGKGNVLENRSEGWMRRFYLLAIT